MHAHRDRVLLLNSQSYLGAAGAIKHRQYSAAVQSTAPLTRGGAWSRHTLKVNLTLSWWHHHRRFASGSSSNSNSSSSNGSNNSNSPSLGERDTKKGSGANRGGGASQRFVDRARVFVKGGTGGQGSRSRGAPGGDGGDVYCTANRHCASLYDAAVTKRFHAKGGANGGHKLRVRRGRDANIVVPVGTQVFTESGYLLADLDRHNQSVIVAQGGDGGSPLTNEHFSGLPGERHHITLELKAIADVGLVGFPNAGKSSLLRAVSRARPAIAGYAFTTLRPSTGVVEFPDHFRLVVGDIPGLIEGASDNRGMGHAFLRHVERTSVLLFTIDVTGFRLNANSARRTAAESLRLLCDELDAYDPSMRRDRPCAVAVNKMDLPGAPALLNTFKEEAADLLLDYGVRDGNSHHVGTAGANEGATAEEQGAKKGVYNTIAGMPVIPISARRGKGIRSLMARLRTSVESARIAEGTSAPQQGFAEFLGRPSRDALSFYREEAKRASFRGQSQEEEP